LSKLHTTYYLSVSFQNYNSRSLNREIS